MKISPYIQSLIAKAQKLGKTIVLPEGEDERVLIAAHEAAIQNIAKIIILGNEDEIKQYFASKSWDLNGIEIINPAHSPKLAEYTNLLYNLRKEKGLTEEDAAKLALNPNYFGTLMIKSGDADGMVSGANHSTADTVRPALQIIKSAHKDRGVSALFIMRSQEGKLYYLSDCAININPNAKELADIALSSAESVIRFGDEPRIAMLSYSTYGSGKGEAVDKVKEATSIAKAALSAPEYADKAISLDGELQADAALDSVVAAKKAPDSKVAGNANVLIFPNIEAGNIGYKLLQRLGGAEMYGPLLQGLNAPVNDLSRGCFAEDIVGVIAITALQSQK
ncbi:MAG: phosphate acetyltransferase [Alphaproteobacteria bacterium]|nr:phosphate acetyltransferase [Alphaproteobacteria bacterium]